MTDLLYISNLENSKSKGTISINTINGLQSFANLPIANPNKKLYSSGAYYVGNFLGNQRNGWGKLHWSIGCVHEGNYQDNKRDGRGTLVWNDGSVYKGDFKNDVRHGYGEISWPNGESYLGMFDSDSKHGHGKYIWPEIGRYEGNFEKDQKHGFGVFTMNNGDRFEGIYMNGQRWGPGIFTYYQDGSQDIGIWKGPQLLRICSVMDDAFLFEHLSHHKINSGDQVCEEIRASTASKSTKRNIPKRFLKHHSISSGNDDEVSNMPLSFPYKDIIEGVRGGKESKGYIEKSSEAILNASKNGHYDNVKDILEEGLVSPDVSDKTGFSAIMAAAVNCHTDVINLLLDHGANINQLTDEGLSVLLACHILLYTKENFVDNIAESMPRENLFNTVEVDRKTGTVTNRNERKMIMTIFENIHRPFNGLRKARVATTAIKTKKNGGASPSQDGVLEDLDEETTIQVDQWKMNFYQQSMDRVKEVEEINQTFKDIMLKDPHYYLTEGKQYAFQASTYDELMSCTETENDTKTEYSSGEGSHHEFQDDELLNDLEKDACALPFPTTVASILGYDPVTEIYSMTVDKQKHLNDKMVLQFMNKERKPHLQNTIQLLLKRGANPNASELPMSALFFAVKSADPVAVAALLQQCADTSARLNTSHLCPLHIAVALPCVEGIEITKLLLQHGADPNLRDSFPDGDITDGRTPLHVVCSREDHFKQCQKIVRLLLEYNADPNLLCVGNAPLSLAIGSGNDLVIDTLLKYNADPSLRLTHGLGSILCVAVTFQAERRRTPHERMRLIEKLMRHGADMLTPVKISDKYPPGTVVDYGYHVFAQDRRIACTPYHALSSVEREVYNSRRAMLECIGSHLRTAARIKEEQVMQSCSNEHFEDTWNSSGRDDSCGLRFVTIKVSPARGGHSTVVRTESVNSHLEIQNKSHAALSGVGSNFKQVFTRKRLRYCYECGRSIGVRLTPCSRCKEVFYCSKGCKIKAWNLRHRDECAKISGTKSYSQTRAESPTPTSDHRGQFKSKDTSINSHSPRRSPISPKRPSPFSPQRKSSNSPQRKSSHSPHPVSPTCPQGQSPNGNIKNIFLPRIHSVPRAVK